MLRISHFYFTLNLLTAMAHNEDIYKEVAEELGLPVEVVKEAYKAMFSFMKEKIEALPLKQFITEEEYSKLRTSFNIPSLGKLACPYAYYKKQFDLHKYINVLRNAETKEN